MKELAAQFRNPGAAYRGKPFWSWNGELKEDELIRQIHVMKEMGLGGFFMHSRTGLVTEYLGDEWFRLTNACADEAERLGMEAWIYDEDRWPSGTAGGMVTEERQHRMKYMGLRPVAGSEFVWNDAITAAFACDLDGYAFTNGRRIWEDTPKAGYAEQTVLVFAVEDMAPSSFYNGNTYVVTLSREATDRFIELTHEQYRERCDERLGRSVKGVFTDEPHRGAVFSGFGVPNDNRLWMTPWTGALAQKYEKQFGEDLIAHLPDLFLARDGEVVSPIKWRYMELLQQMFLQNFAKPLYDWCGENSMQLTGHVLHEDSLACQVCMQGSLMRFYEYMHAPGIDVLTEGNRNYVIVKQLTSAARQLGQKWLLSELYGCTGWQMNFRSHKEVGDWQALLGINLRCHHLSWYTMEGEAKRDYPASILHQSAWWTDYDYVESYFARLGLLLQQGRPVCDVLVINPVESLWCQVGVGWAEGLSALTPAGQALEDRYAELSSWLLGSQVDFDFGDEEMMSRLSAIETDERHVVRLRVGQALYRTVVVGHMTTMRSSTLQLLNAFAADGGRVVFMGDPPAYVDSLRSDEPALAAGRATAIPWDKDRLLAACRDSGALAASVVDSETGEPITEIYCQTRIAGNTTIFVAVNTATDREFGAVKIRIAGSGHVEEWDCRTGDRSIPNYRTVGSDTEIFTTFSLSGERAFMLSSIPDPDMVAVQQMPKKGEAICKGPFAYELGEENVCVLDYARFRIGDGEWQEAGEILQVDRAVRRALDLPLRGGEMVQPWFRRKYMPEPSVLARVILEIQFDIDNMPAGPVSLCAERPELWRFTLNGVPVSSQADGWWVDTAFEKLALPDGSLQSGANVLVLETDFRDDINLEALYLIGDFGVSVEGNRCALTTRPECLPIGDLTRHGFPFYGGAVTYRIPVPSDMEAEQLFVSVPAFEAACIKARASHGDNGMIAFPPYETQVPNWRTGMSGFELEVVLTRRNTFGPLHQLPLRAHAYGPDNFTTGGDNFSQDYMLFPAGLLSAPVISWS